MKQFPSLDIAFVMFGIILSALPSTYSQTSSLIEAVWDSEIHSIELDVRQC